MNKKLRNTLLMIVSSLTVAALAITGTVAYLKSEDGAVNVMTMGNVEIDQLEYERVVDAEGNWVSTGKTDKYGYTPDELQAFSQAKPLYPAVFADGDIKWDDRVGGTHQQSWAEVGASGSNQLFDDSVKNAQDKFVFVKNTGKSDAYVRTWFAFEQGAVAAEDFDSIIRTNGNATHWSWETVATDVEIGEGTYVLFLATYLGPKSNPTGILAPGAVSYPSLLQVYMSPEATNEDVAAIDGNKNGTYDILVLSQAIQTEGFEAPATTFSLREPATAAEVALTAGFGTDHPWVEGVRVPVVPSNPEDLQDSLNNGDDVVLPDSMEVPADQSNAYGKTAINVKKGQTIDGGNYVLEAVGATGTWDTAINATGGTVKNLTVAKGFRGLFINHNATPEECGQVVLENVTIDGCTYTISCDQGTNNGLKAIDCTFNGWTSYAATTGDVEFINCNFGEGNGYAFCRPYAPTAFVGCDFEAGYELDARIAVTFEDCTIGGVALTADNLATLVTSNIANASVK